MNLSKLVAVGALTLLVAACPSLPTPQPGEIDNYTKSVIIACDTYADVSEQLLVMANTGAIKTKDLLPLKKPAILAGEFCSNQTNYYIMDTDSLKIVNQFLTEAQRIILTTKDS